MKYVLSLLLLLLNNVRGVIGGVRGGMYMDQDSNDGENTRKTSFDVGDLVTVAANKIGPYNNPTETYSYYSLPFCEPQNKDLHDHQLGEVLSGDRKKSTDYELKFKVDIDFKELCRTKFDQYEIEKLYNAIDRDYHFEFFVDGLPLWGYIGEYDTENLFLEHTSRARHYVYSHIHFDVGYNKDRVVEVDMTYGQPPLYLAQRSLISPIMKEMDMVFSYSVKWHPSSVSYENRMARYHHNQEDDSEVRWLSILNSFVLVLLLTFFLSIVLVRILKNDFTRYMGSPEDMDLEDDETGWKLIHCDVFRYPKMKMLLSSCVGMCVCVCVR